MRFARRLTHALLLVLTLVVGATAAAIIVTQTAWFKGWLRVYIERQANQYLNGQMSIGRLGGNLFFGIELENIGVSMDGSQVVAVKDLGVDYNVFQTDREGPFGRQHPAEQVRPVSSRPRTASEEPTRQERHHGECAGRPAR